METVCHGLSGNLYIMSVSLCLSRACSLGSTWGKKVKTEKSIKRSTQRLDILVSTVISRHHHLTLLTMLSWISKWPLLVKNLWLIDWLIDTACMCAIRAYNSKIKLRTQNAKLNVTQRLCTASATFAVLTFKANSSEVRGHEVSQK